MEGISEIKIPKGVESISVMTQDDGKIVIEFIPEKSEFKEGDFVYEDGRIMIVKNYPNMYHAIVWHTHSDKIRYNGTYAVNFSSPTFRYATEEEKQLLIDAMKKYGKRWNAETKCIEDIPVYKNGDFLKTKIGNLFIFKRFERVRDEKEDSAFCHFFTSVFKCYREYGFNKNGVCFEKDIDRYCTPEEKQKILDDLAKYGKRWNAETKCIEDIPVYKNGDFLKTKIGNLFIFKRFERVRDKKEDSAFCHFFTSVFKCYREYGFNKNGVCFEKDIDRYCTPEEKQKILDDLAKDGKRWNAEKKCIEDIPKPKFKAGDKVKIKDGISSKTHRYGRPNFTELMDEFIGKELTVKEYSSRGFVVISGDYFDYHFNENWLEPYTEELKKGDLAIFWDDNKDCALIRIYNTKGYRYHSDSYGTHWNNAIKFESKEQFEKVLRGEI